MSTILGLQAISALGLPLDWEVIRLGWEGVGGEPRLLSLEDIRTFADQELVSATESQVSKMAELCTATNEADVQEILERLAPTPSIHALRIWRAVLLDRLLGTLGNSPVDILVELTSFWAGFGYPPESPHAVQGRGNSVSPSEYYTEDMARQALAAHRRWLEREIVALREVASSGGL